MLRDGSLDRYYEISELIVCGRKVRPADVSVHTNERSIAIRHDTITIDINLTSWDAIDQIHIYSPNGYKLAMALIAVLHHTVEMKLIEVDDIKKNIERAINFLKNNIDEIDNLICSIQITIPLLKNYIEKLKKRAKEDIKLWEKLRLEELASERNDETVVSPASVYISEGSHYNSEGDVRLIKEIREKGEFVRALRLQDCYNAQEYVYIYKYNNEFYAIKEYNFDNLQGYTHSEVCLYRIKNPEILKD